MAEAEESAGGGGVVLKRGPFLQVVDLPFAPESHPKGASIPSDFEKQLSVRAP